MGFNTTVVILNDAIHDIADDPHFAGRLAEAVAHHFGKPVWVRAGSHGNAALVVETHHADDKVLVKVGGNTGEVIMDERPVPPRPRRKRGLAQVGR
jgi:hypothetical protein